jgi:hypothetical protein
LSIIIHYTLDGELSFQPLFFFHFKKRSFLMSFLFCCFSASEESRVRWKINKYQRSTFFEVFETKAKLRHTYLSLPRISRSFNIAEFPTSFFIFVCLHRNHTIAYIEKNQLKLAKRKLRFAKSDYVSVAFDRLEISLFDLKAINDFFSFMAANNNNVVSFFITHH